MGDPEETPPDCIHAQCTADLKEALEDIAGIILVEEMRSFFDREGTQEFILLQECPIQYNDDYGHTGDVDFQYNIIYFGGTSDETPEEPFTYQNRNVVADIITAIMADRTRGGNVINTTVTSSGPDFCFDGENLLPVTFVSIDCHALINPDNPYNLSIGVTS